jgi:hypothetical protein
MEDRLDDGGEWRIVIVIASLMFQRNSSPRSARFDALTRALSEGTTRRGLTRLLGGGALAALLGGGAAEDAAGRCAATGGACRFSRDCCADDCVKSGRCTKNGKLTGRCRCGLYAPRGVKTDVPDTTLVGWSECYQDAYADSHSSLPDIQLGCFKGKLLLACRATGSATLSVLAWARRADVLFDTGTGNKPHDANGVGWYFNPSHSWGFAPQGATIDRDSCDVVDGGAADQRLCWNTSSGGLVPGYRCGTDKDLNTSTAFERLVFHAD